MSLFFWFLEHWYVFLWVAGVVVAYIYGGRNLALIVGTLGLGAVAFKYGQETERENHNKRADKIEKERQSEYDKIDQRDTNRDDVIERLHKGDY